MNRIVYQDAKYTIVINDTNDGVRIQVFLTMSINETCQYHNQDFKTYRVSPPGILDRILYGTYESQIKSAVDSLIGDITKVHISNGIQRDTINETFECTKKTLIAMYGE